jgi:hypothetical protein
MDLKRRCIAGALAATVLAVPACALAQEPQLDSTRVATPAADAGRAAGAQVHGAPELGAAADPGQLDATRGRSGVTTEAKLAGTLSGNAASQVATGNNVIQSGSFANASGLPVVIQNSGANVLIQNATVINLQLK